jgi:hypothetical protein
VRRELERLQRVDVQMLVDPAGERRPEPRIDWNSCSGATAPRSRSSCAQRPVRTICAIAVASRGPMPGSASRPSMPSRFRSIATSSARPATVSAARR